MENCFEKHKNSGGGRPLSGRNVYLDYIRGISVLYVVLSHYTIRYDQIFGHIGNYPIMLDGANYFVRIFFLLSGFFGAVALVKNENPFEYLTKRAVKLYPCYWIAILLIFPLTAFLLVERSVLLKDALVSFTMLQGVFGFAGVDGAHWTLILELFFYIDIFIVLLLKLNKHADKILLIWISLMLAPHFISQLSVVPFSYFYKLTRRFCLSEYAQVFAMGASICLLRSSKKSTKIISGIVTILCLILEYCVRSWKGTLFLAVLAIIVYGSEEMRVRNVKTPKIFLIMGKPLVFLAGISYPLYLVHQNIGYIIIKYMEKIGLTNEFFLVIPVGIMIFVSWLMVKYIEKPSIALGQKIINKFKNKKPINSEE